MRHVKSFLEAIEILIAKRKFLSLEAAATIRKNDDSKIPVLTGREKEVLGLIAEGLTNHEISENFY
jgi:DNA-binding NarL/FixJ family response regulator